MATLCALIVVASAGLKADAAATHVILCGSGGEAIFDEKFVDWGTRLYNVLVHKIRVPAEHVGLYLANPDANEFGASVELENLHAAFQKLADELTEDDDLYIYFIGHGSYLRRTSKFHIPGPDLSAEILGEWLDDIIVRRTIILNATASSAAFINDLSAENRVICTATKSIEEINATEFMEHFITGLEDGSADLNHDERISFLEACEQAAELTASWYLSEGLIATEHSILDDNGDGLGSRLPRTEALNEAQNETFAEVFSSSADEPVLFDGMLARACFIQDYSFPPGVPEEWIATYLGALETIRELKRGKAGKDKECYYDELEALLIEAALINKQIRSYAKSAKPVF